MEQVFCAETREYRTDYIVKLGSFKCQSCRIDIKELYMVCICGCDAFAHFSTSFQCDSCRSINACIHNIVMTNDFGTLCNKCNRIYHFLTKHTCQICNEVRFAYQFNNDCCYDCYTKNRNKL
jgi:hypothetical protein